MEINKIQDIDLSQYKLAYFKGDSLNSSDKCQDDVMKFVDGGGEYEDDLMIALIPKIARLSECSGDDWNDCPANCNATGIYNYPKGTIFLKGQLGKELILTDN